MAIPSDFKITKLVTTRNSRTEFNADNFTEDLQGINWNIIYVDENEDPNIMCTTCMEEFILVCCRRLNTPLRVPRRSEVKRLLG